MRRVKQVMGIIRRFEHRLEVLPLGAEGCFVLEVGSGFGCIVGVLVAVVRSVVLHVVVGWLDWCGVFGLHCTP